MIAEDENLETAAELGFGTIVRDNRFLARKYNDGIQLALHPSLNPRPADYAVPMGSDDWIDYRILLRPPPRDALLAFRRVAFVSEDGRELTETELRYQGGVGIRVYPRRLLEPSGYRPADEDRKRACDTSILYNAQRHYRRHHQRDFRVLYGDRHARQIVDWKSHGVQLNAYSTVAKRHRGHSVGDPFAMSKGSTPRRRSPRWLSTTPGARMSGGLYEVVGSRRYRGHRPGDLFEAVLDSRAEARAIGRGDIALLERIA